MLKDVDQKQLKLVIELLQTYLLYATIALIAILVATAILTRIFAPDKLKSLAKIALGIVIGFATAVIFSVGSLQIARMVIKQEITYVFWMTVGLVAGTIAIIGIGAIIKLSKPSAFKIYAIIGAILVVTYSVVFLCLLPETEEYYQPQDPVLYYVLTGVLILIMSGVVLIIGKNQPKTHTTKSISYAAVCIALSYALSYVKFFSMPQGGSVTFASLLPIMIYAYMFGVRKGVACGIIYGALQFLQSPQAYQPLQILIDYPIAFGFIGFAGILRGVLPNTKIHRIVEFSIGATIAVCLRYFSHILSGACVFYSWMPDTYSNPWIYSLAYNSYVLVDLAIVLIAGVFVLFNNSFSNQMNKVIVSSSQQSEQL